MKGLFESRCFPKFQKDPVVVSSLGDKKGFGIRERLFGQKLLRTLRKSISKTDLSHIVKLAVRNYCKKKYSMLCKLTLFFYLLSYLALEIQM